MAIRPVFIAVNGFPFVKTVNVDFPWTAGQYTSQLRINIRAIHEAFHKFYPNLKVLEISSHSEQLPEGKDLSAFFLPVFSQEAGGDVTVECAYQSSKVFTSGGPYKDLLLTDSGKAKKDERLKSSGPLTGFEFDGMHYCCNPLHAFYDYIYCQGLLQNPELAEKLLNYDAFTDIVFAPDKTISCQARTAAIYKGLVSAGKEECLKNFQDFVTTVFGDQTKSSFSSCRLLAPYTGNSPLAKKLVAGCEIEHPLWHTGKVLYADEAKLKVQFSFGTKVLGKAWVIERCKIR